MHLKGLLPLIGELPGFQEVVEEVKRGGQELRVALPAEAKAGVLSALREYARLPILVVVPRPEEARQLYDQLLLWCGDDSPVYLFPEASALPYERLVGDVASLHQRMKALEVLLQSKRGRYPPLIVAPALAIALPLPSPEAYLKSRQEIRKGDVVELEGCIVRWVGMGYRMERMVEVPGTMSRRGGIVDVYPPGVALPTRLEFLGNRVESLRNFDPATQRSVEMVEQVIVLSAREVLPEDNAALEEKLRYLDYSGCSRQVREQMEEEVSALVSGRYVEEDGFYRSLFNDSSLLAYLPPQATLVLDRWGQMEDELKKQEERARQLREVKEARGELPRNFPPPFSTWEELSARVQRINRRCLFEHWGLEDSPDSRRYLLSFRPAPSYWGRLERFTSEVVGALRQGNRVVVTSHHAQRLAELLREQDIGTAPVVELTQAPSPGSLALLRGSLEGGWAFNTASGGVTLLTDVEIFGVAKRRRLPARATGWREAVAVEFSPGDYVVHVDHGIARFTGTGMLSKEEGEREYLILEYAQGDRLYVPTEQVNRVSPYLSPAGQSPSLTRLGTQEWATAKARVKASAREMAGELLELYASREVVEGYAFAPDTPWQREMEDSFPYVETPDQLEAIQQVKGDLEQPRPMDRLVCGDVGYGKTEVALRAAFKAVMEGLQVAVLVPTTVLAQQHYATFTERLSPYPVRVEVLSRFRTDREQKEVVEALAQGKVDIVVGTHRLLQKDVAFKNLGLIVVDEEQRFGVAHKEHLKGMRRSVDALTLSATPIPRTLHISMMGIRDMSTMETPPEERLSIKTYVSEYNDDLAKEAILRELDRGGQVFFVHNRIYNILYWADRIRKLVPHARVAVGHGRLPEEELESNMVSLAKGEIDVLVCTTIIESGLDLPNVNTLMVNDADHFGLAQLYQLRGRIGRGAQRAYAYFLVNGRKQLTEAAEKRLQTILAATELGAGFRIAMKDLEIRGAGNILGPEQSGYIHAVGFDLYCQLLAEAVEEVKAGRGKAAAGGGQSLKVAVPSVKLDLPLIAHIPEEYVPDLPMRLSLYHRLSRMERPQEADDLAEELRDRFGPLPEGLVNLLNVVQIRVLASRAGVDSIAGKGHHIVVSMLPGMRVDQSLLLGTPSKGVILGHSQVRLDARQRGDGWIETLRTLLEALAGPGHALQQGS